jgi:hypothetical protein
VEQFYRAGYDLVDRALELMIGFVIALTLCFLGIGLANRGDYVSAAILLAAGGFIMISTIEVIFWISLRKNNNVRYDNKKNCV